MNGIDWWRPLVFLVILLFGFRNWWAGLLTGHGLRIMQATIMLLGFGVLYIASRPGLGRRVALNHVVAGLYIIYIGLWQLLDKSTAMILISILSGGSFLAIAVYDGRSQAGQK